MTSQQSVKEMIERLQRLTEASQFRLKTYYESHKVLRSSTRLLERTLRRSENIPRGVLESLF
jgi:hypothetical protein